MHVAEALIDPTPPAGEEKRVEAIFKMAEQMMGQVPAPIKLYAISPPLLESFAAAVGHFRNGSKLSPVLTAMIRYLVSERIDCRFCIGFNEGILANLGADLDQVRAAREDLSAAPVEARELPLLALALHAVSKPDEDAGALIEAARDVGWADREIFEAVYQAAANRSLNYVLKTFHVETQDAFV